MGTYRNRKSVMQAAHRPVNFVFRLLMLASVVPTVLGVTNKLRLLKRPDNFSCMPTEMKYVENLEKGYREVIDNLNGDLQSQQSVFNDALADAKKTNRILTANVKSLAGQLKAKKEAVSQSQLKADKLKNIQAKYDSTLASIDGFRSKLREQETANAALVATAEAHMATIARQNMDHTGVKTGLEADVHNRDAKIARLAEDIEKARSDRHTAIAEKNKANKEMETLRTKNNDLQKKLKQSNTVTKKINTYLKSKYNNIIKQIRPKGSIVEATKKSGCGSSLFKEGDIGKITDWEVTKLGIKWNITFPNKKKSVVSLKKMKRLKLNSVPKAAGRRRLTDRLTEGEVHKSI